MRKNAMSGMRTLLAILIASPLAGCGEPATQPAPAPAPIRFERVATDTRVHGERLAALLGCSGCHGRDLTGEDWSAPGFGRMWTSNLTRVVPAYTDAQLVAAIGHGVRPDGSELWDMPSHLFTRLDAADMAAVVAFLRSRPPAGTAHPRPVFFAEAHQEMAAGSYLSARVQVERDDGSSPPDAGPTHALGRYIVRATCAECHGMDLRGGRPTPEAAPRPDLRMVAAYPPDQFARLLRTGIAAGDRELGLMGEVARGRYRHFTDPELNAVYRYLQAVARADP